MAEFQFDTPSTAYDGMDPRPRPGQRVLVAYTAEWGCWDGIKRPNTHPVGKSASHGDYVAPRDAFVQIVEDDAPMASQDGMVRLDAVIQRLLQLRAEHGNIPVFTEIAGAIRPVSTVEFEQLDSELVPRSIVIS